MSRMKSMILLCAILLLISCIDSYYTSSSDVFGSAFGGGKYSVENCDINYFGNINSYKYVLIDNDWSYSGFNFLSPPYRLYENLFKEIGFEVITRSEYLEFPFDKKLKTIKSNSYYTEIPSARIYADDIHMYLKNAFYKSVLSITAPFNKNYPEKSIALFSAILNSYYSGYDSTKQISLLNDTHRKFENITEKEIIDYYNTNEIFEIEGIWEGALLERESVPDIPQNYIYKLGIIKSNTEQTYLNIYDGVIIYTENINWLPKLIKFSFEQTAKDNVFSVKYGDGFQISRTGSAILKDNSVLVITPNNSEKESFILIKKYPLVNSSKNDRVSSSSVSSGSGILISKSGLVVTNQHVVKNSTEISIKLPTVDKAYNADIVIQDRNNDLAILKLSNFNFDILNTSSIPYKLVTSDNIKPGHTVYTIGYPLGDILGKSIKYSSGEVNSLYGLHDDSRVFQISNPVQPGNSGGGLFNEDGELIGVIFSSLNAKYFFDNINIIPQNVNFAIKGNYLLNLISLLPESDEIINRNNSLKDLSIERQIEMLEPFIVNIKVKR